ncbi:MAG: ABC transporter permease [Anaerolineae bacterium]|nr:MAG: ABC transporter permease [Anaerolineae bacterium]
MNAIRHTLSVTWKEILLILKDRGSLLIFFLLPLLLGAMMGAANVVTQNEGEEAIILLHVCLVNEDNGVFGSEVAKAIESIDELDIEIYDTVAEAEGRVAEGEAAAAIVIPASFTADINAYTPTSIEVIVDPGQPESASIVTGIMKQVVDEVTIWGEVQYGIRSVLDESGVLAGLNAEQQRAVGAQTLGVIMTALSEMRRTPAIAIVSEDLAGEKSQSWIEAYFAVMFPGFAVMFIFLNVSWSASSLLAERESGTLRRLLAAPLPRGAAIAGKMLAFMLLSCMQVLVLFAVAHIFFDMPLGQSPLGLVALSLVVALTSAALGMMVAGLAKSASQAGNIGLILGFVLAAIGGCIPAGGQLFFRAEGFMGVLARLTPHAHALDGYYSLMAENASFVASLPQMGMVLAFAVVFFLVAVWRFRFE